MRAKTFHAVTALTLIMALILISSVPADAAWPTYSSGLRKIPAGQYFVVRDFVAQADAGISYEAQEMYTAGPNFDVLLMDKQNFDLYKSGSSLFVYHSVSSLNVDSAYEDTGVGGLTEGVEYLLVIDNTDRPVGGAPGSAEIQVMYTFGGANIQTVTDWGIILIFVVVAVVAVVIVVLVILLLLRRSKRKTQAGPQAPPYAQPYQQPGMKICSRCGAQVPAEFVFCPRCGNRY